MAMNQRHILSLAVIVTFLLFSMAAFTESLSPYVTFAEAKTAQGTVQVRGTLAGAATTDGKTLIFTLRDEAGQEAVVVYTGAKPEGLEAADSLVAIGRYQNRQFMAEKLLVKCPSKYQGSVNR